MKTKFIKMDYFTGSACIPENINCKIFAGILFALLLIVNVSAQSYRQLTKDNTTRNTINEFSFGYGNFQYSHYKSPPAEIYVPPKTIYLFYPNPLYTIDGYTYFKPVGPKYEHISNVFGFGMSHINTYGRFKKKRFSVEVSCGWDKEYNTQQSQTLLIFDVNPSFKYDKRWIGYGVGIHTGLNVTELLKGDIIYSEENKTSFYMIMNASLRLFPYDILYTELRLNDMFPYQIGRRGSFVTVLGSGLGYKDGSGIEIGYDIEFDTYYSVKFWFFNKLGVKAAVYACGLEFNRALMQFSVSYRFYKKNTSIKKNWLTN